MIQANQTSTIISAAGYGPYSPVYRVSVAANLTVTPYAWKWNSTAVASNCAPPAISPHQITAPWDPPLGDSANRPP